MAKDEIEYFMESLKKGEPEVDQLDFFRPARLRGKLPDEKLQRFVEILRKVIADSEDDVSPYRIDYSSAHQEVLNDIEACTELSEEIGSLEIRYYNYHNILTDKLRLESPGFYDAYGRMLAEVEDILRAEVPDV